MYNSLYPIIRLFWRGGLEKRRHLNELEKTQWLSQTELEELQLKKIQNLLEYAYEHVPYYRNLYKREDIHPNDIKSYKDFQALPFITRDDVNNHLDDLVSIEFLGKVYMSQTGGSIGKPMRFFTENSSSLWGGAIQTRGRLWYGVRPGEKMAWVWGVQRDIPLSRWLERLKGRIKQHRYLNAFAMTEAKMQSFAEMLVQWKPILIRAYPSALSIFARYVKEHGITGILPKLVETTSEKLMLSQRQLFEDVFNCQVAECYSSRELYEMAYQCPSGGLHVCETVYLELVTNDQVVQHGQIGEAVITSLTKLAMPFIRYKIDDLGIYEITNCSCGRGLPLLREIVGRKTDCIVTSDGQFVNGGFFTTIFKYNPEVLQFQVYQKDLKHLKVYLVCKQNPGSVWVENIRRELQDHLGEEMQITFSLVDRIELSPAGKHHYVISEINLDSIKGLCFHH